MRDVGDGMDHSCPSDGLVEMVVVVVQGSLTRWNQLLWAGT